MPVVGGGVAGVIVVIRVALLILRISHAASSSSTSNSPTSSSYLSSSSQSGMSTPSAASYTPSSTPYQPVFPDLPAATGARTSIQSLSLTIGGSGPGLPMKVHVYLPAGQHDPSSLPCVFIAPAGTRLFHGSALGDGDSPEHLPYARAGFAVIAYELSGDVREHDGKMTYGELAGPTRQFMAADGGVANAKAAVDFALQKLPEVDPNQLFCAGHSSAAVVAIDVAAADPRIKAVCAYAPACNVESRLGTIPALDRLAPGFSEFVIRVSPMSHVADIRCPIFLFHADDDSNVPADDNAAFASAAKAAGKAVEYVTVPTGEHYRSMLRNGIPAGIRWLQTQGANPQPPKG